MPPSQEILFVGFDGQRYWSDWRDFEAVCAVDAEARTIGDNPDRLILTALDAVFLWSAGIRTD
jgi:hypothetical protein